ncbi:hypothetical protein B0H14DRAFT_3788478 [Mycena olivaceomarginata]|nr:hypothetical protein B0H14DRAFT_3788478 [Mycena olivaceomarginata]
MAGSTTTKPHTSGGMLEKQQTSGEREIAAGAAAPMSSIDLGSDSDELTQFSSRFLYRGGSRWGSPLNHALEAVGWRIEEMGNDLAPTRGRPLHGTAPRGLRADDKRRAGAHRRGKGWEDGDEDWQKKGKRRKSDRHERRDTQIHPGETLNRFNKRVETDVHPLVRSAVQSSLATVRAQHKKGAAPAEPASQRRNLTRKPPHLRPTNTRPARNNSRAPPPPRRLDDIAQAPPALSAFGRTKSANPTSSINHKTPPGQGLDPLPCAAARDGRRARGRRKEILRVEGFETRCDGGERGGGAIGEGGMSRGRARGMTEDGGPDRDRVVESGRPSASSLDSIQANAVEGSGFRVSGQAVGQVAVLSRLEARLLDRFRDVRISATGNVYPGECMHAKQCPQMLESFSTLSVRLRPHPRRMRVVMDTLEMETRNRYFDAGERGEVQAVKKRIEWSEDGYVDSGATGRKRDDFEMVRPRREGRERGQQERRGTYETQCLESGESGERAVVVDELWSMEWVVGERIDYLTLDVPASRRSSSTVLRAERGSMSAGESGQPYVCTLRSWLRSRGEFSSSNHSVGSDANWYKKRFEIRVP